MGYESFDILVAAVPENPDADWQAVARAETELKIVVPWSGGLDSTTLAVMAVQAGFQTTLVSVTAGQPWDSGERRARHFIEQQIPELREATKVEMRLEPSTSVYDHIQLGRNVNIIRRVAELAQHTEGHTEIWLGWLDGETTIAAGDKSHLVLDRLQAEIGRDIRLALPIRFMTKTDLVSWWADQGRLLQASNLYSCFTGGTVPCGHCQACFRFFVGFAASGNGMAIPWLYKAAFPDELLDKYRDKKYTSPRRGDQTRHAIRWWESYVRDR